MKTMIVLGLLAGCVLVGGCSSGAVEEIGVSSSALYTGVGRCLEFDDYQACVCEDANRLGYCKIYSFDDPAHVNRQYETGNYANPASFAPLRNDKMSSVALGAFVDLQPFWDAGYGYGGFLDTHPRQTFFASNVAGILSTYNADGDINDQMSSFKLYSPADYDVCRGLQPVPAHSVAVYRDANYGHDCSLLKAGDYPSPDWAPGANSTKGNFGLPNDSISSLRVGPGALIRIYQDAARLDAFGNVVYFAPFKEFTTDEPDLSVYGWNDKTSAIQVF